jgi:hypothetical protein
MCLKYQRGSENESERVPNEKGMGEAVNQGLD